jgi:hypothetical protein
MPRRSHKPEEIVAKLRQVDVLISQGQSVAEAIRAIGVSDILWARIFTNACGFDGSVHSESRSHAPDPDRVAGYYRTCRARKDRREGTQDDQAEGSLIQRPASR